jgi:hypothetical protein
MSEQFRKKPVVIEAMQYTGDNVLAVAAWAHQGQLPAMNAIITHDGYVMRVRTLEGSLIASPGDWVIRGIKGELYPCKPDIFAATYEPVAPPLPAGPPLIDPHREHLAFVAVMNALDVHMPPDGAALLMELRAIAATVGYPWRGAPLPTGPVAPPLDLDRIRQWFVRHRNDRSCCECSGPPNIWSEHMEALLAEIDVLRERMMAGPETCQFRRPVRSARCADLFPDDQMHWCGACLMEVHQPERFREYVAKLREAPRGAARPSQPPEQAMTTNGEVHCALCGVDIRFIDGEWLDRETHSTCNLRVVGGPPKHGPHPVARPPASPPALEAYRALVAWLLGENGEFPREPALLATRQRFWWRTELRARQRAIEAALAVSPEAPPP